MGMKELVLNYHVFLQRAAEACYDKPRKRTIAHEISRKFPIEDYNLQHLHRITFTKHPNIRDSVYNDILFMCIVIEQSRIATQ